MALRDVTNLMPSRRSNFTPDPPDHLLCPITRELLRDPVVCADGHTYEREAIETWLQSSDTSPLTNCVLPHRDLVRNHALRGTITEWKESAGQMSSAAGVAMPVPAQRQPTVAQVAVPAQRQPTVAQMAAAAVREVAATVAQQWEHFWRQTKERLQLRACEKWEQFTLAITVPVACVLIASWLLGVGLAEIGAVACAVGEHGHATRFKPAP